MNAHNLVSAFKVFHRDLEAHFDLWRRSLQPPLPDYPVRNTEELREQTNSLARQLGRLRPYIERFAQSTVMAVGGVRWDIYDSAVGNDIAIRKGSSIEAALPQLQQIVGRLEAMPPEAEIPETPLTKEGTHRTVNVYNLHGAHSRVNIQSEDRSVNVLSITEQQVFSGLRDAITEGVPDPNERTAILEKLNDLEKSIRSPGFLAKYQAFINTVASHMTIILPFIPALTQMLGQ